MFSKPLSGHKFFIALVSIVIIISSAVFFLFTLSSRVPHAGLLEPTISLSPLPTHDLPAVEEGMEDSTFLLATPRDFSIFGAQNIAFTNLKPGINNFDGTIFKVFDIETMRKGNSVTLYVEDETGNCSSGCTVKTDYFFDYNDKNFKLNQNIWQSGGTAGTDVNYSLSIPNSTTGEFEKIGSLGAEEELRVIGYKDLIILSGSYYHYHGKWSEDLLIYDVKKGILVPTKNFTSGAWGYFWADVLEGMQNTLYIKDKKVYLRAPKNQCYFISNNPTYTCSGICDLERDFADSHDLSYVYAGCTAGYYPIDDNLPDNFFKDEYLTEALDYEAFLKTTDWKKIYTGGQQQRTKLENFQYTPKSSLHFNSDGIYLHPVEWLSPLMGRTLNMALAGEEERAWKMFREDFRALSEIYPLVDAPNPDAIEADLGDIFRLRE